MADKHSDETGSTSIAGSSESTVEIRIKTLDSQSYQFHVDTNMLVSAFKEKIAGDVGLPVGQQRLIFRGKVLKDELRLSEYHVGSGDTLHLVARQPSESQPSSGTSSATTTAPGSNTGQNANAGGARPRVSHISHSVVLGTFADRNEDGNPDLSRVIGAVLNSFGVGGQGQASMGGSLPNMQFNVPVQVSQGNEAGVNANDQGQQGNPRQPTPQGFAIPLGPGMALPTLVTPIPDSLHTLSEFMNRMEQALSHNGYQHNQPPNGAEGSPAVVLPSGARGVPTPAALAVVMRHALRLLSGPATESLSHTARRLEEEESCTDLTVRTQIQSETMQSGLAMQHLGALLLELGRTMLTSRIGQSPAESSVNAGPAVYISPTGPNPIMAQPFPLQTNSMFGGHNTPISSTPFGPLGVPRHINVHIHAGIGPRGTNVESNQGEHANETSNAPAAAAGVNVQARGADDSTRSENPASQGQPDESVSEPEGRRDTEGAGNTIASSSATKSASDVQDASSSTPASDNSTNAPTVPLGLGLGGLQPKRRSRQTKPEVTTTTSTTAASVPVPPVNAPAFTPAASGQLDPAAIMSQMVANPAIDGLLSGVSSQTGIGSPDVLRNMLGQLTQNPAMMNTVNQIAQQIDGNQDLSNMFSGMGGGGSGGGGGFDLSGMIQQMMPIVAQAFGGGGSGLNMLQQPPSMDSHQHQPTSINDSSSDPQMNVRDLAEKIEQQQGSPDEVFSSVVEAAARMNNNGDELSELLVEEGLVDEFMEMFMSDVLRLTEEEGEGK